MIDRIRAYYTFAQKWFWSLPVWKRAILTSFIGALGGSSIIGFFNKYALYYHAYRQKFRIPVEGVEYLDLAVTLVSFAIILTSIIGTITIYYFLNLFADFFTQIIVRKGSEETKRKTKLVIMISQFLIPMSIVFLGRFIANFLGKETASMKSLEIIKIASVIISFFTIFFIGYTLSKNENHRKAFTLGMVAFGIGLITASLFNQKLYSNFLKTIHYGGRIPIRVEYRKADNTESVTEGNLLIRTNSGITLANSDNSFHEEIPVERVSKIIFIKKKTAAVKAKTDN